MLLLPDWQCLRSTPMFWCHNGKNVYVDHGRSTPTSPANFDIPERGNEYQNASKLGDVLSVPQIPLNGGE